MPNIHSIADLCNSYDEISTFCHQYGEPVFITKNGRGDLAVLSIEAYEALNSRLELYRLLLEGLEDIQAGRTKPFDEAMAEVRAWLKEES